MEDTNLKDQIQSANDEIHGKRSSIGFPAENQIEIDSKVYIVQPMIYKLILDAITANQMLVNSNKQLRDNIAQTQIGKEIMN